MINLTRGINQIDLPLPIILKPVPDHDHVQEDITKTPSLPEGSAQTTGSKELNEKAITIAPYPDIPETFSEWAAQFNHRNHFDRFVVVAAYLYQTAKTLVIDSHVVMDMYARARWEKPQNPADVFAKAAKQRLFVEAETEQGVEQGRKSWRITRTGLNHLDGLKKEWPND